MSQSTKKATRDITILIRYYIKKSGISNGVRYEAGSVVLLVENDKGVRYYTTIRPNGVHSCECPSRKPCYHITHCATIELAREAAAEQALAAIEQKRTLAREVEAIVVEAEKELAREVPPARELAPLNGNRPFSFFR